MRARSRLASVALCLGAAACSGGGLSRAAPSSTINPFGGATNRGPDASSSSGAAPVDLRTGECFDVDSFQAGVPIDPKTVHLALCARPHQHEVIATFRYPDVPGAPWPGSSVLDAWTNDHCIGAFPGYVGIEYQRSTLDVATVRPDEESWKRGDRAVACAAHDVDFALLTGSVKGTAK